MSEEDLDELIQTLDNIHISELSLQTYSYKEYEKLLENASKEINDSEC